MAGSAGTALRYALRAGGEPRDGALGSGPLAGGVRRHGGAGREGPGRKGLAVLSGLARGGVLSGGYVRARRLTHARVAAGGGLVRGVPARGRPHRRLAAGGGSVRRELAAGALLRLSGVHGRLLPAGALLGLPRKRGGLAAGGRAHRAAGVAGRALGLPSVAVRRDLGVLGVLRAARGLGRSLRAARPALTAGVAGRALGLPSLAVRRDLGAARLRGGVVVLRVRGMLAGRGRAVCLLRPRCGMLALGVGGR
ncbi:hypothetical protein A9R04_03390 [Nocardiopsis dassonvillei]|nr:hypothetical protein A9R04_03390 [Nocardiopsis dassonvillei]